jgi:protein-L-isoaspartate(D-aspartate) O-methyltransferase
MTSQPAGDPRATHLVDRLEIQDARVRAALLKVPRDRFVPAEEHATAYDDTPVPLGVPGATASAPHMAVLQLEAAQLAPGQKVLEIGGGMGYLGALIAELVAPGGSVDLVELDAHLVSEARQRLAAWSPPAPVRVHAGDGSAGWPGGAPYDRILASCQTPAAPTAWLEQLRPGGRLVVPIGDAWEQRLTVLEKGLAGVRSFPGPGCRFVPLRRRLPRDI